MAKLRRPLGYRQAHASQISEATLQLVWEKTSFLGSADRQVYPSGARLQHNTRWDNRVLNRTKIRFICFMCFGPLAVPRKEAPLLPVKLNKTQRQREGKIALRSGIPQFNTSAHAPVDSAQPGRLENLSLHNSAQGAHVRTVLSHACRLHSTWPGTR